MSLLGKALGQYAADYDDDMPAGSTSNNTPDRKSITGVGWASQVYPYVRNVEDFDDGFGSTPPNHVLGSVISFAYNRNSARTPSIAKWTYPSRTVLLYQVKGAHAIIDLPGELKCNASAHLSPAGDGTYILLLDGQWPRSVEPGTGAVGERLTLTGGCDWPNAEVDGGSFY